MRLLVAAVAATFALAAPGHGAVPKPQIVDPTGDALPPISAGYDVVSALFRTEGTTAKVGRRTLYTPTKLVVTVTYAGSVPTEDVAAQVVMFDAPGCARVYLERYALGSTYGTAECLADPFSFNTKASGKTLTFTLPFATVGKGFLKPGAVLTNLRTYTSIAEPVLGFEAGEVAGPAEAGTVDNAETDAPYRVG